MGTVQNLYVFPGEADNAAESAIDVVTSWYRAEMLNPEWHIGAAVQNGGGLIEPRRLFHPSDVSAAVEVDAGKARARLAEISLPRFAAFDGFNVASPDIKRDFGHYQGSECWIAAYELPQEFAMKLVWDEGASEGNPEGEVVFDRTVQSWVHLQGKTAPWRDQFFASRLHSLAKEVWPDLEVVEHPYL